MQSYNMVRIGEGDLPGWKTCTHACIATRAKAEPFQAATGGGGDKICMDAQVLGADKQQPQAHPDRLVHGCAYSSAVPLAACTTLAMSTLIGMQHRLLSCCRALCMCKEGPDPVSIISF